MVSISLYRGKLHRSPDVPREWLMPARKISLKDFKILLQRRSRALSRLQATNPNPDVTSLDNTNSGGGELSTDSDVPASEPAVKNEANGDITVDGELANSNYAEQEVNVLNGGDEDESLVIPDDVLTEVDDSKSGVEEPEIDWNATAAAADDGVQQEVKSDAPLQHQLEPTLSDVEKRKKEIEEKLEVLKAKKHNLVQVLKQILKAEEELQRRGKLQGSTGRPSRSLRVDVGNDIGSMSRHATPLRGSEGNYNSDMTDADDGPNQTPISRLMPRMSSVSPSSDSAYRWTPFATMGSASRPTSGVAASSPSRFGGTGSGTGTNYFGTSSPSPFSDARLPSPWN